LQEREQDLLAKATARENELSDLEKQLDHARAAIREFHAQESAIRRNEASARDHLDRFIEKTGSFMSRKINGIRANYAAVQWFALFRGRQLKYRIADAAATALQRQALLRLVFSSWKQAHSRRVHSQAMAVAASRRHALGFLRKSFVSWRTRLLRKSRDQYAVETRGLRLQASSALLSQAFFSWRNELRHKKKAEQLRFLQDHVETAARRSAMLAQVSSEEHAR